MTPEMFPSFGSCEGAVPGTAMALHFESASHYDENPQPLRDLINSTADLGRADRMGLTLLHYACREGHLDAVVALVEAGAPLEAKDRDARTPLHLACLMAGKLEMTRGREHVAISNYLQYEGAIPSTQDKYGHTPLSYLPQRAKRLGLMTPSVDGRSAMWAVEQVRARAPRLGSLLGRSWARANPSRRYAAAASMDLAIICCHLHGPLLTRMPSAPPPPRLRRSPKRIPCSMAASLSRATSESSDHEGDVHSSLIARTTDHTGARTSPSRDSG
jgi:hypothetical protein